MSKSKLEIDIILAAVIKIFLSQGHFILFGVPEKKNKVPILLASEKSTFSSVFPLKDLLVIANLSLPLNKKKYPLF